MLSPATQEQSLLGRISQTATTRTAPWGPDSYGEPPLPGHSDSRPAAAVTSQGNLMSNSSATLVAPTQYDELQVLKEYENGSTAATLLQGIRRKTSDFSKYMRISPNRSNGRPPPRPSRSDSTRAAACKSPGSASWSQSGGVHDQSRPETRGVDETESEFDELTENVWRDGDSVHDGASGTSSVPAQTSSHPRTSDVEEVEPRHANIFFWQQAPKLILPSADDSYGGFCQGAWRMQIGDAKGGMKRRQDAGPGASMYYFWKCVSQQCAFNGEFFGTKKCPAFDPRVRVSKSGIRFRWSFLASRTSRSPR